MLSVDAINRSFMPVIRRGTPSLEKTQVELEQWPLVSVALPHSDSPPLGGWPTIDSRVIIYVAWNMDSNASSDASSSWTSTQSRENLGFERHKLTIVDDLGHSLQQVALPYFEGNILPPLPDGLDIGAVIEKLVEVGALQESLVNTDDGKQKCQRQWTAFPTSFTDWADEDATYSALISVTDAILSAAKAVCNAFQPRMMYNTRPREDILIVYDQDSGSSKPDGYFVRSGPLDRYERRHYWHEVAVSGEYNLSDSKDCPEMINNRQRTCWNMYQQLRQDPRRRFSLAFTIEKTTTRFWFCNRSKAFVSESFDFLCEGSSTFLQFVLRIVAAEEHQLGWDTSMVQRPLTTVDMPFSSHNLMYDIVVDGANSGIYRTTKLIKDVGARAVHGSGTRVWEVKKVRSIGVDEEPTGSAFALKDSWVDTHRLREAEILEQLKASGEENDTVFEYVMETHFLTVECYGDVRVEGEYDHTLNLHAKGQCMPENSHRHTIPLVFAAIVVYGALSGTNGVSHKERKRLVSSHQVQPLSPAKPVAEKQHQRTVFKEVVKSLHDCDQPQDVLHALSQIVLVLKQIHQAGDGWVHRDISAGNILIGSDGKAKLADLEYAKQLSDRNSHEVRTGTAYFMACEADERMYLYMHDTREDTTEDRPAKRARLQDSEPSDDEPASPIEEEKQSKQERFLKLLTGTYSRRRNVVKQKAVPRPRDHGSVFFHNVLHDLESIFWIAVYFLFDKEPVLDDSNTGADWARGEQQKMAAKLFYNRSDRVIAMSPFRDWAKYVQVLHPVMQPAAALLGDMRDLLIARYTRVESKFPLFIDRNVGGQLYEDFSQILLEAAVLVEDVVIRNLPRVVLIVPVIVD